MKVQVVIVVIVKSGYGKVLKRGVCNDPLGILGREIGVHERALG